MTCRPVLNFYILTFLFQKFFRFTDLGFIFLDVFVLVFVSSMWTLLTFVLHFWPSVC